MEDRDTRDLLIQIKTEIVAMGRDIADLKTHADNGGWSRCMLHEKRVDDIEKCLEQRKESQTWFNRVVAGSVVLLFIQKLGEILIASLTH